jgi:integrase
MRVPLKGINSKRVKLASGQVVTYWYAWKGGTRLQGEFGSPEFHASYTEAVYRRKTPQAEIILTILRAYQDSEDFLNLAPRTRSDYVKQICKIEREFGTFPLAAIPDRRTRGEFLAWRDRLAKQSKRQADYAWSVLSRVMSWAHKDRGLIPLNPCKEGGRLYHADRCDKIWSDADEAAFMVVASEPLKFAIILALWTGQRQGDLLRLPWSSYDGNWIRLRQSKTRVRVSIPILAGTPVKRALDAAKRISPVILVNSDGKPWSPDGFRSSWNKACKKAGIVGLTFHDLRGTAVTRLALAGATEPEIATITGHSLSDVKHILEHYLRRDPQLAVNAITKLKARTFSPENAPE